MGTEKFYKYLLGHKCVVFVDNNPLCHLQSAKLGATKQEWAAKFTAPPLFQKEKRRNKQKPGKVQKEESSHYNRLGLLCVPHKCTNTL